MSNVRWARIALGGGMLAAVVVVIALVVLGGEDARDELRAGPATGAAPLSVDDALIGTNWVLAEGVGPQGEIVLVPGYEPTLEIGRDGFSGNLSCNDYGYRATISAQDDGTAAVSVEGGFSKAAGCLDDGVMESEEAFGAALTDVTFLELDGELLILSGDSSDLTFRPGPPPADGIAVPLTETVTDLDDRVSGPLPDGLDGTHWTLVSGGSELPLPAAWRRHRLRFIDDRFSVTGMCSWYDGVVGSDGSLFGGGAVSVVAEACPAELETLDAAFVNALGSVRAGRFEEGRLHLAAAAGDLVFQRDVLDEGALTGVRWELTGWDLDAGGAARPVDSPAFLELGRTEVVDGRSVGSVLGSSGCIAFAGEWQRVDHAVSVTVEVTDADGCPDPLPDQDLQFLAAVGRGAIPLFLSPGTMHLYSIREPEAVSFALAEADAGDPGLDGTMWQLVDTTSLPIDPEGITLTFDSNTFNGAAPCNGFGGRYRADGETFLILELSTTERGCERSADEEAFIDAVLAARRYGLENGRLIITSAEIDLIFEPS